MRLYGANRGRRTPSDRGSGVRVSPCAVNTWGGRRRIAVFSMGRATGGDLGAPVESIEQFQETVVWYRVLSDIEAPKQRQSSGKIPFRSTENRGPMRWKRSMGIRANPAFRDRLQPIATHSKTVPPKHQQGLGALRSCTDVSMSAHGGRRVESG